MLNPRSQRELEITHATNPNIRHGVANSYAIVSDHTDINNVVPDVRRDVSNAHLIVSEIRPNTLKIREDLNDQNIVVSIARPVRHRVTGLQLSRLMPGQQPQIYMNPLSDV